MTLRLFLHAISLEARTAMSYRADFWLKALFSFVAELGVYVFLAWALFAEAGTDTLRGFDRTGLVLYYVAVMLTAKLATGNDHSYSVMNDIYTGGLTRYLLFPRPYVGLKYAQRLGGQVPLGAQALVFTAALLVLAGPESGLVVTPGSLLRAAISIAVANWLVFLLRLPLEMVAFWQDNVWSLGVLLRNATRLLGGGMVPLALFPGWAQAVVGWLPFRHVYDVPVRTLLGHLPPAEWAGHLAVALGWCLALSLLGRWVWRRGLLQYTGVGI